MIPEYYAHILESNIKTFKERDAYVALTEAESQAVTTQLIANILKSAVDKSHVDFGDIPNSKGRIEKYKGYSSMVQSLDYMDRLSGNGKIQDIATVRTALEQLTSLGDIFDKGFKLNNKFVILTYNSVVLACVEATSGLIAEFMKYIQEPSTMTVKINYNSTQPFTLCLKNLENFNTLSVKGEMRKSLSALMGGAGKENFIGAGAILSGAKKLGAIAGMAAMVSVILPVVRELVFLYYNSRAKISDFLSQQAHFVEMSKASLESDMSMDSNRKASIKAKQEARIKTLLTLSDKIAVHYSMAEKKAVQDLDRENRGWTLSDVQNTISSENDGFQLV